MGVRILFGLPVCSRACHLYYIRAEKRKRKEKKRCQTHYNTSCFQRKKFEYGCHYHDQMRWQKYFHKDIRKFVGQI